MARVSVATLALLLLVLPLTLSAQETLSQPQQGYTFSQGTTLRWFGINVWNDDQAHAICRAECANDPRCRAYAYVRVGGYNPNDGPACYLMANGQNTVPHGCCMVAFKGAAGGGPPPPAQGQFSQPQQGYTFQGGTTLRWFGINVWNDDQAHAVCRAECANDPRCRAYAYVRIGGYNPNDGPVCYLMANVPNTVAHRCCVVAFKQSTTSGLPGGGPGARIDWTTSAEPWTANDGGAVGRRYTFLCPPNGTAQDVAGTGVYAASASICTAAVHAGVITFQRGGTVIIEMRGRQESYAGSARNGVTTRSYPSWTPFSFAIVGGG